MVWDGPPARPESRDQRVERRNQRLLEAFAGVHNVPRSSSTCSGVSCSIPRSSASCSASGGDSESVTSAQKLFFFLCVCFFLRWRNHVSARKRRSSRPKKEHARTCRTPSVCAPIRRAIVSNLSRVRPARRPRRAACRRAAARGGCGALRYFFFVFLWRSEE